MTSEFLPKDKQFWNSRANIPLSSFLDAAKKLGLRITQAKGGTSHYAIRKSDVITNGLESLITTVYEGMPKQAKGNVIKSLLKYGIEEKALIESLK